MVDSVDHEVLSSLPPSKPTLRFQVALSLSHSLLCLGSLWDFKFLQRSSTWHSKFVGANNNQPILVAALGKTPYLKNTSKYELTPFRTFRDATWTPPKPAQRPVSNGCSVARRVVKPVLSCARRRGHWWFLSTAGRAIRTAEAKYRWVN